MQSLPWGFVLFCVFKTKSVGIDKGQMAKKKELPQTKPLSKSRNQLITIAILIGLIYAAACAVLVLAGQNIVEHQKWPIVIFMVVFPLFALAIFGWLVSKHHTKLYSGTSNDADMSLSTLTPDQQRRKLNAEVTSIISGITKVNEDNGNGATEGPQRNDIRMAYVVAEDLALRQLEIEYGETFMRHASLEGVPFDGVWVNSDNIAGIEVKLLDVPFLSQEAVDSLLDKAEYAASRLRRTRPDASFHLVLALVTQLTEEDQAKLRMGLENKFALSPVKKVEVKPFDFDFLQNVFMADKTQD
jgi:hypothetical protein